VDHHTGAPIEPQDVWQIFDHWRHAGREVGVIFWGRTANVYSLAVIESGTARPT
jgi:hypothetical protein